MTFWAFKLTGSFTLRLSLPCRIFETFSHAVHWIAEKKLGIPGVAHILDDFLFVCGNDLSSAKSMLGSFLSFAADIALPINHDKTVPPCTTLSFVGIKIDSVLMEVRLPQDKFPTAMPQWNNEHQRLRGSVPFYYPREKQSGGCSIPVACFREQPEEWHHGFLY